MILKNNSSVQSFTGRIGQKDFIILFIFTLPFQMLANILLDNEFYFVQNETLINFTNILSFISIIFVYYIRICACVKRLRDIKWCIWFGLFGCIPVVYLLFACFKSKYKKVLSSDDNTKSRKDIQKCQ